MGWFAGTAFALPAGLAYTLHSECTWSAPSADSAHPLQAAFVVGNQLLTAPARLPCASPQTVHIHPSSGLSEIMPRWLVYHELGEWSR